MIIVTIRSLHFNWNIDQVRIKTPKTIETEFIYVNHTEYEKLEINNEVHRTIW